MKTDNTPTPKYKVVQTADLWKVVDTVKGVDISVACPKDIAEEICEDFNKMDNKDYSPLFKDEY